MTTVFVPNLPSRWDTEQGIRVATVDITKALEFGSPRILVPQEVSLSVLDPAFAIIRERMVDCSIDDCVIAVGDPALIAFAVHVMLSRFGRANLLRWSRVGRSYQQIQINA